MKRISTFLIASSAFLLSATHVLAAVPTPTYLPIGLCPQAGTGVKYTLLCSLSLNSGIITRGITIALVVATLIALAFLIFGGIRWILSGGEKEKVEEARGTVIAALVGLIISFLAYFLINIVFGFFGIGKIGDLNAVPLLNVFSTEQKSCTGSPSHALTMTCKDQQQRVVCDTSTGLWSCK